MLEKNEQELNLDVSYIPLIQYITYLYHEKRKKVAYQNKLINDNANSTFIIGICGPVSVGKSTMTSLLLDSLKDKFPKLAINSVSTDDFLYSNSELRKMNLLERKGFPESYDHGKIINFLKEIRKGENSVIYPIYSHELSDIVPDKNAIMKKTDILLVEGINTLQLPTKGINPISDYLDFSIYIDADLEQIRRWYIQRFFKMVELNHNKPNNFFYKWGKVSKEKAINFANSVWYKVNLPNIKKYIIPTRQRADLIVCKGENHLIERMIFK